MTHDEKDAKIHELYVAMRYMQSIMDAQTNTIEAYSKALNYAKMSK